MSGAEAQRPLTAEEEIESTLWQLLRRLHLRAACHYLGRLAPQTPAEQNALLEPWFVAMEEEMALLRQVVARARAQAIEHVHLRLHAAEGIDDEMLDQAIQYARPLAEGPSMCYDGCARRERSREERP